MYLSHLHIENFRCFKNLDIEFRKGLNIIVGENNIGKTNIIEAIRITLGPGATWYNRVQAQKSDLYRDRDGNTATSFLIRLIFSDISPEQIADFIECLNYDDKTQENSKLQISYRWTWNEVTQRPSEIRWGSDNENERIANEVLQSILLTYLEPLRDALSYLVAGRGSRIGTLLQTLSTSEERETLIELFKKTNQDLEEHPLVKRATQVIAKNLQNATSQSLAQRVRLASAPPKFDSIVNSLTMILQLLRNSATASFFDAEIKENGLGYNNLLYMATVLAELSRTKAEDVPLLFIEEPEAHLHPQLQTLLAMFLLKQAEQIQESKIDGATAVNEEHGVDIQIFVTTHSPVFASQLPPNNLIVLHHPATDSSAIKAASLWKCELDEQESRKLQRLLDVTKATMFFAKSIVLVEGICEQLLVPVFARRIAMALEDVAVSIIPTHGVGFSTIAKLFGKNGLELRCAIITDADPPTTNNIQPLIDESSEPAEHWRKCPQLGKISDTTGNLKKTYDASPLVQVFHGEVTLEYDLALGNDGMNAILMADVWADLAKGKRHVFTREQVSSLTDPHDKACFAWQAICLSNAGKNKAPFAHELALQLAENKSELNTFIVPDYIRRAILFVWEPLSNNLSHT